MSALLTLFLDNLLPILLAAGVGYLAARWLKINPRPLSQATFYIFSPCLIFRLLTTSELSSGAIARMVLFASVTMLLVGAITWLVGRALKFERRILAAVLITTMFMNAGNYGLPLVLFAFDGDVLAYATLYFVTMAVLAYSIGVVVASLGSASLLRALANLVKIPTIYALALALVFMRTGWALPPALERTTNLLADASIPTMLVLLGMQLQAARWSGCGVPLGVATAMRLVVAPAIALLLSAPFGLGLAARQAGVLEAGMPSAVLTTVLATEFNLEPAFVTAVVFSTTLLSPLTLVPLLAFLGG